mmetsp:Transcript_17652/g.29163  ORF Transcript_17652/g.29163 Transcript_17652/m.29163 type:complete len:214 (-) Transcript_17652:26-667(-)
MFKKGLKINLSNPLKNSAVRKLKAQAEAKFPGLSPYIDEIFPTKSKWIAHKAVGKIIVYSEAKSGQPLFFHLHNGKGPLVPTVYLIWKYPKSIPMWLTPPDVWRRLHNGADLMLAGVFMPKGTTIGEFQRGDVRCVAIIGNPHAIGVGITAVSSDDVKRNGRTGKGLLMMHLYADPLWALGSKSRPNEGFKKNKVVPIEAEEEEEEETSDICA